MSENSNNSITPVSFAFSPLGNNAAEGTPQIVNSVSIPRTSVSDESSSNHVVINMGAELKNGAVFDGISMMRISDSEDWHVSTSDVTIEVEVIFATNDQGVHAMLVGQEDEENYNIWFLEIGSNLRFSFRAFDGTSTGGIHAICNLTPVAGTKYHLAYCRSGNTHRMFINGIEQNLILNTLSASYDLRNYASYLTIGAYYGTTQGLIYGLKGTIKYLKITKGEALYTSNFTPTSNPAAGSNTVLFLDFRYKSVAYSYSDSDSTPREVPVVYDEITNTYCSEVSREDQRSREVSLENARKSNDDLAFLKQVGFMGG